MYLVIVTGHAAAGKSTLAPRLADAMGAIWISRDRIHEFVHDGWVPEHPRTPTKYDPEVLGNTYFEGGVVWNTFLWVLGQVCPLAPVVADTPFNHDWNRDLFQTFRSSVTVPIVEVALHADPDALARRLDARSRNPRSHPLKQRRNLGSRRNLTPYEPVMDEPHQIHVDTTDLDVIDVPAIARRVRALTGHSSRPGS